MTGIRLIGLTGGIGSGKSAAAARFQANGIPVIDADKLGHEAIAPGGDAEKNVLAAFGDAIVTEGRIDRAKLAARVFADAESRKRLNEIVHPIVRREIARRAQDFMRAGHHVVLVEAALLGEDGRRNDYLDGLILVLASKDIRVDRLVRCRPMTSEEARRRIDAQTPPESKIAISDYVVNNEGSMADLHQHVDRISAELKAYGPAR